MTMKRPTPRPPEPVDVENPQWIARAWQWVFDQLSHLDECVDGVKETQNEYHAEVTAMMAAKEADHQLFEAKLEKHEAEHKAIEERQKAKASVWKLQGKWAVWLFEKATQGSVIGFVVYILSRIF